MIPGAFDYLAPKSVEETVALLAQHGDDELRADAFDALEQRIIAFDDDLRQAMTIANVEEQQRSEVADAMHPAEQHRLLADVTGTQRTAGVGSSETA